MRGDGPRRSSSGAVKEESGKRLEREEDLLIAEDKLTIGGLRARAVDVEMEQRPVQTSGRPDRDGTDGPDRLEN